jgi:D-alanyl-D-alanine carboxypeptidase (penicillin-binding protein 5/6)
MRFVPVACLIAIAAPGFAAAPPYQTAAPIAYLWDTSSGAELYVKDADKRMPPASMAKMMTVYVLFDMVTRGELKLDQQFLVTPDIWQHWHGPEAGSTMFLSVNEKVSVANLISGIVTLSGNDACVTVATGVAGGEAAFAQRMNAKARELGLSNSHFGNSNGWPDNGVTYTTARDLAHLAAATVTRFPALYKQFYGQRDFTWGKTMAGHDIKQDNRNPLLGHVEGADGLKTGHTDEAGYGFTGSADQGGRRLVMVVAGLDSKEHRVEESLKLIGWGFKAWSAHILYPAGKHVGEAQVQMGTARTVGLMAPQNLAVTLPGGANEQVKVSVAYEGPVRAPIMKGQHIADLVMTTADTPPQKVPLVAEATVEEAGFFSRIWLGLLALFGA